VRYEIEKKIDILGSVELKEKILDSYSLKSSSLHSLKIQKYQSFQRQNDELLTLKDDAHSRR
jgi:hypothetical protein